MGCARGVRAASHSMAKPSAMFVLFELAVNAIWQAAHQLW
jgi:hypothetical protein